MYPNGTRFGHFFAEKNVLYVVPYSNPWGWMNNDEVRLTDEILDVIFDKFGSNVKIRSLDNGSLSCTVEIQQSPIFINWCCSFGPRLRVVSRPSTIEKIKEHLKEVGNLYE